MSVFRKANFSFVTNLNFIFWVYVIITVAASIQKYLLGPSIMQGVLTTHYNNFLTFKYSFRHLIDYKDIYLAFPQDHFDLFKYSPAFALFMGIFYYLPELLGLILWNLLNTVPVFFAVKYIKGIDLKTKSLILLFCTIELLTSIQSAQSNGLILALVLFAFNSFENKKTALAALFLMLTVFIKVFGLLAFLLFLFYPEKCKFIFYSLLWFAILLLIPLVAVSPGQLIFLYKSWFHLLAWDQSVSIGLSVKGWLTTWFGLDIPNSFILMAGLIILCIPLFKALPSLSKIEPEKASIFKLLFLSGILIWMIIFNHKAESPTYIIAICGAAIWYFTQKKNWFNYSLLILAFIFTCLSPTDIFPRPFKDHVIIPYVLKAVPCIFIWLKLSYDLIFNYQKIEVRHKIEKVKEYSY